MSKKFVTLTLVAFMALMLMTTSVFASEIAGGECGENATWSLDSDGTFTVSGEGPMSDMETQDAWDKTLTQPWEKHEAEIRKVVIEEGITHVGVATFAHFDELKSVEIASTVKSIGTWAFYNCPKIEEVNIKGQLTEIGAYAFAENVSLVKLMMPDEQPGLMIRNHAFMETSMEKIIIPRGVDYIGEYAFYRAKASEVVWEYPIATVDRFSSEVFCEMQNLKKFVIPDGQTAMFPDGLRGCENLEELWIPYSIGSLNDAISGCTGLKNIYLGGSGELWDEMNLGIHDKNVIFDKTQNVQIHKNSGNNKYIFRMRREDGLYWDRATDGTLTIYGNGKMQDAKYYGNRYKADKDSVKKVIIEDGVTSIMVWAFDSYSSLEEIHIPDSVTVIESEAFRFCNKLASLYIPDSVTSIGAHTFSSCQELTTVVLPKNLEVIEKSLFSSCPKLESIVIPKSVKTIKENAFSWNYALTDIYYEGSPEEWAGITVENQDKFFTEATVHYNFGEKLLVTFYKNGGTEGPETLIVNKGDEITIPEQIPVNGTIKFMGWAPAPGMIIGEYNPGDKITIKDHTTLYAAWLDPRICTHEWGEKDRYDPGDCWGSGYYRETCIHCGLERTGIDPATEHEMGEWIVEVEQTETQDGKWYRICSLCNYREEKILVSAKRGDVNCNGTIEASDATQILRAINGKVSRIDSMGVEEALKRCDINDNGSVDASDATQILRYVNGKASLLQD